MRAKKKPEILNISKRIAHLVKSETRMRLAMDRIMATVLNGNICMPAASSYHGYLMSGGNPMRFSPPAKRINDPTM